MPEGVSTVLARVEGAVRHRHRGDPHHGQARHRPGPAPAGPGDQRVRTSRDPDHRVGSRHRSDRGPDRRAELLQRTRGRESPDERAGSVLGPAGQGVRQGRRSRIRPAPAHAGHGRPGRRRGGRGACGASAWRPSMDGPSGPAPRTTGDHSPACSATPNWPGMHQALLAAAAEAGCSVLRAGDVTAETSGRQACACTTWVQPPAANAGACATASVGATEAYMRASSRLA